MRQTNKANEYKMVEYSNIRIAMKSDIITFPDNYNIKPFVHGQLVELLQTHSFV